MADGFLGRWSRRKLDVQAGKPVAEPPPAPPPAPAPVASPVARTVPAAAAEPEPRPAEPAPTLEDAHQLTPESDFTRFTAADVAPEVKNAAMKKLFADPHFNVMDGLDVYIDDYGLPDPIPQKMLRSLASAEVLGLFRQAQGEDTGPPSEKPDPAVFDSESVAQLAPGAAPAPEPTPPAADADPDLRLQQDHAPGPQGPGDGAQ